MKSDTTTTITHASLFTGIGTFEIAAEKIHKIAESLVEKTSDKELHEKLIKIFPLEEGQKYIDSLCTHYRGRLKHEGKDSLIVQMCSNSLRRLIVGLSS